MAKEAQEVNNEIARIVGIRSKRIAGVTVKRNIETKETIVVISARISDKQEEKIKNIIIEHLKQS